MGQDTLDRFRSRESGNYFVEATNIRQNYTDGLGFVSYIHGVKRE